MTAAESAAGGGACRPRVDVVLVHYPVKARTGEIVTTAVTSLDIHDIARAARTFGVRAYHIVTPIAAQRALVEGVVSHWRDGPKALRVPERVEALAAVRVEAQLDDAVLAIRDEEKADPILVVTSANPRGRPTSTFAELRERIASEVRPIVLCFGTGWGLADSVFEHADVVLEPIMKGVPYNHLSVRVAVGIVLDRLLGDRAT